MRQTGRHFADQRQPPAFFQIILHALDLRQILKDQDIADLFSPAVAQSLNRRGHAMKFELESNSFGRGEIIWNTPEGTLGGATESRTDGCVAAW